MKIVRPQQSPKTAANRAPLEPFRSDIIDGLLAMRRAGIFQGVWVDADVIRVREFPIATGPPSSLTWRRAADLVFAFRHQK